MANMCARIGAEIIKKPMPPLWHSVPPLPPQLERIVLEVLRDAISQHAEAEIIAARTPSDEHQCFAYSYGIFLFTSYAALMHKPKCEPGVAQLDPEFDTGLNQEPLKDGEMESNMRVVNMIRARLQKAEIGEWDTLMEDLLKAKYHSDVIAAADYRATVGHDGLTQAQRHQKAVNKMQAGDIVGAKNALVAKAVLGGGSEFVAQITELIAAPTDSEEEKRLEKAFSRAKRTAYKSQPKSSLVRLRLQEINAHAEPGPSGIPNLVLSKLWKVRGGVGALQRWIGIWVSGRVCSPASALWNTSKMSPSTVERRRTPGLEEQVRPIALSESIVKLAESCII